MKGFYASDYFTAYCGYKGQLAAWWLANFMACFESLAVYYSLKLFKWW